jgi:hypothetical protein
MFMVLRNGLVAALLFCLTAASAGAQQPPAAPAAPVTEPAAPIADSRVDCRKFERLERELTRSELQTAQLCQEVSKLQAEVRAIQQTNESARGVLGQITPLSALIQAVGTVGVALIGGTIGFFFRRSFDKAQRSKIEQERLKLEQERQLEREGHNLKLFASLDGKNSVTVQFATAAALLKRIEQVRASARESAADMIECVTISDVVLSLLRDPDPSRDPSIAKFVADEIVDALGVRKSPKDKPEKEWRKAFPGAKAPFPLSDLNFQGAKLAKAYWAGVQAQRVDFYRADLSGASLAFADLSRAELYRTNLTGATLTDANLSGANLNKADLSGADLTGANLDGVKNIESAIWNEKTLWPASFTPQRG